MAYFWHMSFLFHSFLWCLNILAIILIPLNTFTKCTPRRSHTHEKMKSAPPTTWKNWLETDPHDRHRWSLSISTPQPVQAFQRTDFTRRRDFRRSLIINDPHQSEFTRGRRLFQSAKTSAREYRHRFIRIIFSHCPHKSTPRPCSHLYASPSTSGVNSLLCEGQNPTRTSQWCIMINWLSRSESSISFCSSWSLHKPPYAFRTDVKHVYLALARCS